MYIYRMNDFENIKSLIESLETDEKNQEQLIKKLRLIFPQSINKQNN